MYWIAAGLVVLLLVSSLRKVPNHERALVLRGGKSTNRVVGPGVVLVLPFLESLRPVSIEPLSLSLPIQSAITRDEIPIQLQASFDAEVFDPGSIFNQAGDWRLQLMSHLQLLMKDKLEDLDFDHLDEVFPSWIESIRQNLEQYAQTLGVKIKALSISNLSPRTRPES